MDQHRGNTGMSSGYYSQNASTCIFECGHLPGYFGSQPDAQVPGTPICVQPLAQMMDHALPQGMFITLDRSSFYEET